MIKKSQKELLESVSVEEVLDGFLATAIWSTIDYETGDGESLAIDANYSVEDIEEDFIKDSKEVVKKFLTKSVGLFTEEELANESQIGHDLWLTMSHHGAGFWDGDYKRGDEITKICHEFPEMDDSLRESIIRGSEEAA